VRCKSCRSVGGIPPALEDGWLDERRSRLTENHFMIGDDPCDRRGYSWVIGCGCCGDAWRPLHSDECRRAVGRLDEHDCDLVVVGDRAGCQRGAPLLRFRAPAPMTYLVLAGISRAPAPCWPLIPFDSASGENQLPDFQVTPSPSQAGVWPVVVLSDLSVNMTRPYGGSVRRPT